MRGVIAGAAFACALALAPAAFADNVVLYPNSFGAHTIASWRAGEGQPDTVGAANEALWLEKDDGDSTVFAAATLNGLAGQKVQSLTGLEWERRTDGDCNKLAPRWTLVVQGAKSGRQYVVRFGCAQSLHSAGSAPNWIRDYNPQTLIRTRLLQAGAKDALAGSIVSLTIVYDQRGKIGYTVLDDIKVLSTTAGSNVWTCAADNAAALPEPSNFAGDDVSVNPFSGSDLLTLDEIWPTMTADDQAIAASTDPVSAD
jgi:hypothetical protein